MGSGDVYKRQQYGQALKCASYTDIYALGATLYHMVTGKVPVSAIERAAGVVLKTAKEVNSGVSHNISSLIDQAMSMDISQRPQTVTEFLESLTLNTSSLATSKASKGLYESTKDPWQVFGTIDADKVHTSKVNLNKGCLLYTSPSPRDLSTSRMPSSA